MSEAAHEGSASMTPPGQGFMATVEEIAKQIDPKAFQLRGNLSKIPIVQEEMFVRRAKARCAAVRALVRAPIGEPPPTRKGRR